MYDYIGFGGGYGNVRSYNQGSGGGGGGGGRGVSMAGGRWHKSGEEGNIYKFPHDFGDKDKTRKGTVTRWNINQDFGWVVQEGINFKFHIHNNSMFYDTVNRKNKPFKCEGCDQVALGYSQINEGTVIQFVFDSAFWRLDLNSGGIVWKLTTKNVRGFECDPFEREYKCKYCNVTSNNNTLQ